MDVEVDSRATRLSLFTQGGIVLLRNKLWLVAAAVCLLSAPSAPLCFGVGLLVARRAIGATWR